MSELRNRLLKNSGVKVLNEDAEDKLKELIGISQTKKQQAWS